MLAQLYRGDPRCSIPLEARVRKKATDPDDTFPIGICGKVVGNGYLETDGDVLELYLVCWDGVPVGTFETGLEKLEEIKEHPLGGTIKCGRCEGKGWIDKLVQNLVDIRFTGTSHFSCPLCGGSGRRPWPPPPAPDNSKPKTDGTE